MSDKTDGVGDINEWRRKPPLLPRIPVYISGKEVADIIIDACTVVGNSVADSIVLNQHEVFGSPFDVKKKVPFSRT
ncbi:MAG: hypothetical protein GY804_07355 [Alphaproteobacteria bacterium]|nr:hypothetical protein [Alphaproteobacteria bacterium]